MKKIGTAILTILFGGALFVGSSFAAEEQKSGAMGQETGMQTQQTSQSSEIHKAGDLIGKTVKNQQGEELGELSEILFDNQGEVKYLILSKGEVLGMGGDMIPVPWQAANAQVQEDSLTVNIEKQKLDNAPTVKEEEYNKLTEQQFEQEVRGYFGEGQQSGQEQQQKTWKMKEGQQEKEKY
jgi:sporulation protein YlmC with PRC-barrel domain